VEPTVPTNRQESLTAIEGRDHSIGPLKTEERDEKL